MRELRPLLLPTLVASENTASSPDGDMGASPGASMPPGDLHQSAASECSTPITPTFSARHARYPSSNSSLSSTQSTYELVDCHSSAGKLPGVEEEPTERDGEFVFVSDEDNLAPCLCDVDICGHQKLQFPGQNDALSENLAYDLSNTVEGGEDGDFSNHQLPKRRRSGNSSVNSIASRFGERFPSLSRRFRDRKAKIPPATQSSRSSVRSYAPSSRSSSLTGAAIPPLECPSHQYPPTPTKSVHDRPSESAPSSPIQINPATSHEEEPINRNNLSSTPLLPPIMTAASVRETPVQSPLQSPSVAGSTTFSSSNTPVETPQLAGVPTPPLSTKPSISSLQRSRAPTQVSMSEIPPIAMPDPNDHWAIKLGHANYTIYPEPYLPERYDATSCKELLADWEQARCNFLKHQVRTGEHFGVTSKTYKLTEEKWAETDALWKKHYELSVHTAAESGQEIAPSALVGPAPLVKMPSLNDPKSEGKFPKLGDEDIVGPMVQFASHIQQRPSKKTAFFSFLNDVNRVPNALFRRHAADAKSDR